MKKILLGTSAIVLAGAVASPAAAAEWAMRVGGYMSQHVGYVDNDLDSSSGDFDGLDVKEDSEIHFSPSITLDNGIRISARIELEGRTNSDQIDETYLSIVGSFGNLRLGEDDQVAFPMQYTAPNVGGVGINSGSDTKWYGGDLLTITTTTRPAVTHDAQGIMYYSPRMAGFQIGASYARDGQKATVQSQHDADSSGPLNDVWSVGANYVNSFGDANVALAAVYTTGDDHDGKKIEHWGFGGNVGFGGFTVGGSYAELEAGSSYAGGKKNDKVWDAGVSYTTGPWGFSFTYVNADMTNSMSYADGYWACECEGESWVDAFYYDDHGAQIDRYQVAISYDLASGVNLSAYGIYSEAELKGQAGLGESPGDDAEDAYENAESFKLNDDALIIGTSISVSF